MKNTIIVDGKKKTCRIYDNGGQTFDRYTIAFRGYKSFGGCLVYPYLASSENPFHPQGFGQHGESTSFLSGKHLGKRVAFEDVPDQVKKLILQELNHM